MSTENTIPTRITLAENGIQYYVEQNIPGKGWKIAKVFYSMEAALSYLEK